MKHTLWLLIVFFILATGAWLQFEYQAMASTCALCALAPFAEAHAQVI